uniref:Uncharacterized protein n=1 Tax=Oryza nivara TaxID=4536 RepID=A0A0E0HX60_ORYNI
MATVEGRRGWIPWARRAMGEDAEMGSLRRAAAAGEDDEMGVPESETAAKGDGAASYGYIPVPQDADGDKCVVLVPTANAADWSVAEVKGGGGGGGGGEDATATTKMIQMRPVGLGIARTRPGGDRLDGIEDGIEDDIDEVKDPGEDQAVHQPMLPVLVRGSAPEKSDLDHPGDLTAVLLIFGTMWCILAMGFLLHLHAKESKALQRFTSIIPRVFLSCFSYLVMYHISFLIPNKKAAHIFWYVKVTVLLSLFHAGILIWVVIHKILKKHSNISMHQDTPINDFKYVPRNDLFDIDEYGHYIPSRPRSELQTTSSRFRGKRSQSKSTSSREKQRNL